MHPKTALTMTVRKTLVITATGAALAALALGHPAHAATPKGPHNCELGSTALPDDRWAYCAAPTNIDYCDLGAYLLPDDRWVHCAIHS